MMKTTSGHLDWGSAEAKDALTHLKHKSCWLKNITQKMSIKLKMMKKNN